MNIIIGKTAPVQLDSRPDASFKNSNDLPVRILHQRPARSRKKNFFQGKDRRDSDNNADPINARVLLLLVPDGNRLPPDLDSGKYQLRLRIIPEKDNNGESKSLNFSSDGFSQRV